MHVCIDVLYAYTCMCVKGWDTGYESKGKSVRWCGCINWVLRRKKGVLLELQNEDEIKYYKHPQGTSTKENRVKEMKFVS